MASCARMLATSSASECVVPSVASACSSRLRVAVSADDAPSRSACALASSSASWSRCRCAASPLESAYCARRSLSSRACVRCTATSWPRACDGRG